MPCWQSGPSRRSRLLPPQRMPHPGGRGGHSGVRRSEIVGERRCTAFIRECEHQCCFQTRKGLQIKSDLHCICQLTRQEISDKVGNHSRGPDRTVHRALDCDYRNRRVHHLREKAVNVGGFGCRACIGPMVLRRRGRAISPASFRRGPGVSQRRSFPPPELDDGRRRRRFLLDCGGHCGAELVIEPPPPRCVVY